MLLIIIYGNVLLICFGNSHIFNGVCCETIRFRCMLESFYYRTIPPLTYINILKYNITKRGMLCDHCPYPTRKLHTEYYA